MRINTNLEKEFNLAPADFGETEPESELTLENIADTATLDVYNQIDKIEAALPVVRGLDSTDEQLDELADLAIKAHKDLMDLSINVEQRFTGEIASAAGNMLGHAIAARTNKIKKKLDMIALQIKKQIADQKSKSNEHDTPPPKEGQGHVLDRNDLLHLLLNNSEENNQKR